MALLVGWIAFERLWIPVCIRKTHRMVTWSPGFRYSRSRESFKKPKRIRP